tara:strand:+ start:260 stop:1264 length:1005 start_codon:yes stop_codon:yes gene_type:complete
MKKIFVDLNLSYYNSDYITQNCYQHFLRDFLLPIHYCLYKYENNNYIFYFNKKIIKKYKSIFNTIFFKYKYEFNKNNSYYDIIINDISFDILWKHAYKNIRLQLINNYNIKKTKSYFLMIQRHKFKIISNNIKNKLKKLCKNKNIIFKEIYLEDVAKESYIKEVSLVYNASHILGSHGSGLTNIVYANSNCKIYELIPNNIFTKNDFFFHFKGISKNINLNYNQIKIKTRIDGSNYYYFLCFSLAVFWSCAIFLPILFVSYTIFFILFFFQYFYLYYLLNLTTESSNKNYLWYNLIGICPKFLIINSSEFIRVLGFKLPCITSIFNKENIQINL